MRILSWRIIAGFIVLILGVLTLVVLPEVGVPLILLGTRLLGEKFKWAAAINIRLDKGWRSFKLRVKRTFGK